MSGDDTVYTRAAIRALKEDASNRALRTFVQGLGIDLLGAVAVAVTLWLPDADLTSRDAWIVLGTGLARTALQTGSAYIMRRFMDPSGLPTPLPPIPAAPPNEDTGSRAI